MLLTQDVEPRLLEAIRLAGPPTFEALLEAIDAAGASEATSIDGVRTSILHWQVEQPWVWAEPGQVATHLESPANVQQLVRKLSIACYKAGFACFSRGSAGGPLLWPCLACNTPCQAAHSHEGEAPARKASAAWGKVRHALGVLGGP